MAQKEELIQQSDQTAGKILSKPEEYPTFVGKITAYGRGTQLAYVVDKDSFPTLMKIMQAKDLNPCAHPPDFRSHFIFLHPVKKVYFRATRLPSNRALPDFCKLLLIDTGELIDVVFACNNFFHIPENLSDIPPMFPKLCSIAQYPNIGSSHDSDDFIKAALDKYLLKFTVKDTAMHDCKMFNMKQECYKVDVDFVNAANLIQMIENFSKVTLTKEVLEEHMKSLEPPMELTYSKIPVMISDVKPKYFVPSKDSQVLVYPIAFVKPNVFFGLIRLMARDWSKKIPKDIETAVKMKNEMNDRRLKFIPLSAIPVKNQLVIASRQEIRLEGTSEETFYYRALVLDVSDAGDCELFFIDYGFYEKISFKDLFTIPLEFSIDSFCAYRIKVSNFADESKKSFDELKEEFGSFQMGIVTSANDLDVELRVFNRHGFEMNDFGET